MKSGYVALVLFFCLRGAISFGQSFTLLKDFVPGTNGSNPAELTKVNGILFFVVTNPTYGRELWKSDGTPSGTILVKDIRPGSTNGIPNSSNPAELTNVDGILFFSANDGIHGKELWKSDGTTDGTILIKDGVPGCCYADGDNFTNHLTQLTASNGKLFFQARDHENGTELWVSDGTESGTVVRDIYSGGPNDAPNNGNPLNLTDVNGVLYFSAQTANGFELWKSDGTEGGTMLVKDINTTGSSNPSNLVNVNGTLYFTADDGINGNELWKSDGTPNGTILIDIYPGQTNGIPNSSNPLLLTNVGGTLYFEAENEVNNRELWKSNGTDATTTLVKDLFAGTGSGHPLLFTDVNGSLFLAALDWTHGFDLWKSNGTDATTALVKDIVPGLGSSNPYELTAINGSLFFTANDGVHGRELWKSDGTDAGTVMVQNIEPDIDPGGNGSAPESVAGNHPFEIIDVNGKIFITPTTSAYGQELWVYDPFVILPVTSLELKGKQVQNNAFLQWQTMNEINTSAFIVERSTDGRIYNSVGTVLASGTANGIRNYQFTDQNITSLVAPVIYYRVKQKDVDGRFTYSRIISLSLNSKRTIINLYPNPVKNEASLMLSVNQDEYLHWQIIDNTGRIVKHNRQHISAGSITLGIDVKDLTKGVYYLQIQSSSLQQHLKFIKN